VTGKPLLVGEALAQLGEPEPVLTFGRDFEDHVGPSVE
jgi:hypothetical protein